MDALSDRAPTRVPPHAGDDHIVDAGSAQSIEGSQPGSVWRRADNRSQLEPVL